MLSWSQVVLIFPTIQEELTLSHQEQKAEMEKQARVKAGAFGNCQMMALQRLEEIVILVALQAVRCLLAAIFSC